MISRRGRGEAQDAQLVVDEDRGDAGAGQQVVHVVVGAGQIGHLGVQFGVDGGQFLVDRLQLFLGGFQFLVGGLQFFVDRLHFLVRRLELFVGASPAPRVVLCRYSSLARSSSVSADDARLAARRCVRASPGAAAPVRAAAWPPPAPGSGVAPPPGSPGTAVSRCSDSSARRAGRVTGRMLQIDRVKWPLVLTRSPGVCTGSPRDGGLVQRCGQSGPQALAGHLQDVVDAGLARRRLQDTCRCARAGRGCRPGR